MTGVDLDESTNWLAVFTPDLVDSTVNAVKDHLSDLGVPANALRVEERAVLTIPTPPAAPVRGATGRTRRSVPAGASPTFPTWGCQLTPCVLRTVLTIPTPPAAPVRGTKG